MGFFRNSTSKARDGGEPIWRTEEPAERFVDDPRVAGTQMSVPACDDLRDVLDRQVVREFTDAKTYPPHYVPGEKDFPLKSCGRGEVNRENLRCFAKFAGLDLGDVYF